MIKEYKNDVDLAINEAKKDSAKCIILVVKLDNKYFTGTLLDLCYQLEKYKLIYFFFKSEMFIKLK